MNKKQLSEHIGNIDDRLVQQAEIIPNYVARRRQKRIRQLLATVAALVLMFFGFSIIFGIRKPPLEGIGRSCDLLGGPIEMRALFVKHFRFRCRRTSH